MAKVGIFFADGCEEIEGLAVVVFGRRAIRNRDHFLWEEILWLVPSIKFQTDAGI